MRLDSVTRILFAAVQVNDPFESRTTPARIHTHASAPIATRPPRARSAVRDHDDASPQPQSSENESGESAASVMASLSRPRAPTPEDLRHTAESAARYIAGRLNFSRSSENSFDGQEAALFDSMAWSSSRMAAINRLEVHTGSDGSTIAGTATSEHEGETTSFTFTGTVSDRVGRNPTVTRDMESVDARDAPYQGSNYRLTTGNGGDVLNVQMAAQLEKDAGIVARVANAQLYTGGGNDTISLSAQGRDTSFQVLSGSGDDTVVVTSNSRTGEVAAGSGNDHIVYAGTYTGELVGQSTRLDGGSGNDTIVVSGQFHGYVYGGTGADTIDIRNAQGHVSLGGVSDDHISANSATDLTFDAITGKSQVDMTGENQTGQISFFTLRRDQVNIAESGNSLTVTDIKTGGSVTFDGVAKDFGSRLKFLPPLPPPTPYKPAKASPPPSTGTKAPVTILTTQASVQLGKVGATATAGGALAGAGYISSASVAAASSSGAAVAAGAVTVINAQDEAVHLQSALQAKAINTVV